MPSNTRRIAIASIFGVVIFLIQGFIPPPNSDFLIVFQTFFLALSFLTVRPFGATYVGVISGLLISVAKPMYFPLDLVFASLFGLVMDGLGTAFRAKQGSDARLVRLVSASTIATALVGFSAYYLTAVVTHIVPNDVGLDLTVLIFGIASGAVGGYLAGKIWNRDLRVRFGNDGYSKDEKQSQKI
ncbi:MAG: hypothetical protein JRN68_10425 [Nitrososphaerota archaeon]|jgi:hypothetical protein|nr:hypothetical protein [Nitrososphaerota archaeon]